MGDYRKLKVWKMAHELTISVYRAIGNLPDNERYGLVVQMRRAAVSRTSNITEGCGRNSGREMAQFIRVALGSSTELEYQILLSRDLRLLDRELADGLMAVTAQIRAMLASLQRKVVPQRSGPLPPH